VFGFYSPVLAPSNVVVMIVSLLWIKESMHNILVVLRMITKKVRYFEVKLERIQRKIAVQAML